MNYKFEEMKSYLEKNLTEKRFFHSLSVMERIIELARLNGIDEELAKMVGLMHDVARDFSLAEMKQYAINHSIEIDEVEEQFPILLHAKIGANICKEQFSFPYEMQQAIRYHTTGHKDMDGLSKILFVADKSSKDRHFSDLETIIEISNHSLDEGVLYILEFSMKSSMKHGTPIHTDTVIARNHFLKYLG